MEILFTDNDMIVEATGVADEDGNTITGATGTAQVYESDRTTTVGSQITLADQGGGEYRGTIPDSLSITEGRIYHVKVTITDGTRDGVFWARAAARQRRFDDTGS